MNDKNLQYLKDKVKYLGFGEKLFPEMEKNIQQGFPEFLLRLRTDYQKDKFSAVLHFKKSESTGLYFFDQYNATVERWNGEKRDFTFHVFKGEGVTSKEAYNLLCGRAVFKNLCDNSGKKYTAWIQLDLKNRDRDENFRLKQYHQNYGFDLAETLKLYPIVELDEPGSAKMLLRSLEKGNLQSVTFNVEGSTSLMFIDASPRYKTINIYDTHFRLVQKDFVEKCRSIRLTNEESAGKEKTRTEMLKENSAPLKDETLAADSMVNEPNNDQPVERKKKKRSS